MALLGIGDIAGCIPHKDGFGVASQYVGGGQRCVFVEGVLHYHIGMLT